MTGHPPLGEQDLKHLELLQSVISRLGNNSFLVKGWCITLNSVLVAAGNRSPAWTAILVAVTVTVGFWLLDGYYLRQERLFRTLYERIVAGRDDPPPVFTMDAQRYGGSVTWLGVLLSRPLLFCYGVLATADSMLILFLG
ncbi:hypothetical protein LK07_13430 [Streptomyces pluripotens]|uniref:Uncharacterized protein n=1 Tax=Streptomyces pluripotens TaxID=1355015 RepID=A0A221NY07_9ACTN|nr:MULTISPECIES: hypothetical protein [Streptomyces]ARP70619.1 hypothetical protein LK06_012300 [Streptomyces pluripotens]ASN24879.1 hypothetical protein LK07_13430 [Streptomyces pluripotens]KIE23940.1 hypothetical protein LK08_27310 [Streptomyces sp. MUSC 125]MCH0556693.1 hypothetical protein [Streptomyces sp. MUM 16J]